MKSSFHCVDNLFEKSYSNFFIMRSYILLCVTFTKDDLSCSVSFRSRNYPQSHHAFLLVPLIEVC